MTVRGFNCEPDPACRGGVIEFGEYDPAIGVSGLHRAFKPRNGIWYGMVAFLRDQPRLGRVKRLRKCDRDCRKHQSAEDQGAGEGHVLLLLPPQETKPESEAKFNLRVMVEGATPKNSRQGNHRLGGLGRRWTWR